MAETAAITVKIDTAPLQAMLDKMRAEIALTRLVSPSEMQGMSQWAWEQGYAAAKYDAENGTKTANPHTPQDKP